MSIWFYQQTQQSMLKTSKHSKIDLMILESHLKKRTRICSWTKQMRPVFLRPKNKQWIYWSMQQMSPHQPVLLISPENGPIYFSMSSSNKETVRNQRNCQFPCFVIAYRHPWVAVNPDSSILSSFLFMNKSLDFYPTLNSCSSKPNKTW